MQKGRLIRLVRGAGRLRDVILAWPQSGIHVAAGTFEERELDQETRALLAACIGGVPNLPTGQVSRIDTGGTEWIALCDRRQEDQPIVLIRGAENPIDMPQALASIETMFELLQESRSLHKAETELQMRSVIPFGVETATGIGLWQLDLTTSEITFSTEAFVLHGLDPEGPAPNLVELAAFYEPDVRETLRSNVERSIRDRVGFSFVMPFRRADGASRIMRVMGHVARDGCGRDFLFGMFQDVTEERETQVRLWSAAHLDALTGASNRFHWQLRLDRDLEEASRGGRCVGLVLVDLDHFKAVNDCHGHEAGDEALKAVAQTLSSNMRAGDLLARIGGDEFAIVISDLASADELKKHVERFTNSRQVRFEYRGASQSVNLSFGAAVYPGDAETSGELYRAADVALFRSKADRSRGSTYYDVSLMREHEGRTRRSNRIRDAIQSRALVNLYQPIVDLRTGEVVGADMRPRWSDDGRLSDLSLIESEKDGRLLPQLGAAMLDLVIGDVAIMAERLPNLPDVVIPLRWAQLNSLDVLDRLRHLRDVAGAASGRINLLVSGDPGREMDWPVRSKFLELLNTGVGTVMPASEAIRMLLLPDNLPLRHVKIPLEAVRMSETGSSATVLTALIEAARQRDIRVSALALATSLDVERVLAYRIRYGQGSYFGEPVPVDQFVEETEARASRALRQVAG